MYVYTHKKHTNAGIKDGRTINIPKHLHLFYSRLTLMIKPFQIMKNVKKKNYELFKTEFLYKIL